jgi:hypothetical protein
MEDLTNSRVMDDLRLRMRSKAERAEQVKAAKETGFQLIGFLIGVGLGFLALGVILTVLK